MKRAVTALLVLSVAAAGCGYALAGRNNTLPSDVRRIGIPLLQNHSTTPELDRIFTEAVRIEFQSRGKYVVVPETTGVDAVLSGTIQSANLTIAAFTPDRQALRYAISVVAAAEFKLTRDDRVFWSSNALRVSDEYDVTPGVAANDLGALFTQDRNALDRLAREFARKLVTTILENF